MNALPLWTAPRLYLFNATECQKIVDLMSTRFRVQRREIVHYRTARCLRCPSNTMATSDEIPEDIPEDIPEVTQLEKHPFEQVQLSDGLYEQSATALLALLVD